MPITNKLIAKLLLAVSVIPAAGYGGYCVYDHYYPTLHSQLIEKGWMFSPINGDLSTEEFYYRKRSEIFEKIGGDWRCSKQLFGDFTTPSSNNKNTKEDDKGTIPTAPTDINTSNPDYDGCLVAVLGYPSNTSKKAAFLKWELALRSGDNGFIYVGYFSIGNTKDASEGSDKLFTTSQQSSSIVFEIKKESEAWNIKNGLGWNDYFSSFEKTDTYSSPSSLKSGFENVEIKIEFPDKREWKSNGRICELSEGVENNKCPEKEEWTFQKYVGFWEKNENNGEQAINAIKIKAIDNEKKEHLHDIWSQTDFDFSKSTQEFGGAPAWGGSIAFAYNPSTNKWKNSLNSTNAKDYLKAIYSPWAKKKGNWINAEGVCDESNSRSLKEGDIEAQRLLKFCYKNKKI